MAHSSTRRCSEWISNSSLDSPPRPLEAAQIAVWVAVGLAVFTVIFGTRNLDVNERHHGVVTAIAVEALVKLAALMVPVMGVPAALLTVTAPASP